VQKPDGSSFGDPYNPPKGRTPRTQRSRLTCSLFQYFQPSITSTVSGYVQVGNAKNFMAQ